MPAASLSTPRAAPSTGLTRAPVASARSTSRSVSRGWGVAGSAARSSGLATSPQPGPELAHQVLLSCLPRVVPRRYSYGARYCPCSG
jgi:hypothetical protein